MFIFNPFSAAIIPTVHHILNQNNKKEATEPATIEDVAFCQLCLAKIPTPESEKTLTMFKGVASMEEDIIVCENCYNGHEKK